MSGIYLLDDHSRGRYKIGCSENVNQRLKSGDYHTMYLPNEVPKLVGWISTDGYKNRNEIRFLEQSVFHQLAAKRIVPNRELFNGVTLEEINKCISNLQLIPKVHTEMPIDNGARVRKQIDFTEISIKDFQVPILASMKIYFDTNDRGKLILPCGYGKSYLALFLIKEKFNTAIIACPSILLCSQFEEIARQICTEHSINSPEMNKWIIITTYQSIEKYQQYNPELFIIDEAHRTCVPGKAADELSSFRSLLNFPASKYLFMTATEKVIRSKNSSENASVISDEDEIISENQVWYSMDNENSYGKEIFKKDFSDAIEEGVISDYRLVIVNSGDPLQIITNTRETLGIKHLLTYHNSCESARNFLTKLLLNGISAFYIDGDMSVNQRNNTLKQFENTPNSVLCSVNVLSEGISLPHVDSVFFVDAKNSEIDIIQKVGRALRLHKDKTLATIILPENILEYAALLRSLIVFDPKTKGNMKRKTIGLNFSNDAVKFATIESDLNICIMGRMEALWNAKFRLCQEYEKSSKLIREHTEYKNVLIGRWLNRQQQGIAGKKEFKINAERMAKLLQLNSIQEWMKIRDKLGPYGDVWDFKLKLCQQYENSIESGRLIQTDTIHEEVKIGYWLDRQKKDILNYQQGKTSEERHRKLFQLQTIIKWYKNVTEDTNWMNTWKLCVEYESKNEIIVRGIEYEGCNIGNWIAAQRQALRGKSKTKMTDERISRLYQLQTIQKWSENLNTDSNWLYKYNLCIEYESLNSNNYYIAGSRKYKEVNIGFWLGEQRQSIRGVGTSKMNKNRLINLFNVRTFREWYELHETECLPEFRNFSHEINKSVTQSNLINKIHLTLKIVSTDNENQLTANPLNLSTNNIVQLNVNPQVAKSTIVFSPNQSVNNSK